MIPFPSAYAEADNDGAAPKGDITPSSLDHLVTAGEERGRDGEPECVRGLEVDHQPYPRCLSDWQVRGAGSLENMGQQVSQKVPLPGI
jgi:hypothetical protein